MEETEGVVAVDDESVTTMAVRTGDNHGPRSVKFGGEEGVPLGVAIVDFSDREEPLVVAEEILQCVFRRNERDIASRGDMGAATVRAVIHIDSHTDMEHQLCHCIAFLVGG